MKSEKNLLISNLSLSKEIGVYEDHIFSLVL